MLALLKRRKHANIWKSAHVIARCFRAINVLIRLAHVNGPVEEFGPTIIDSILSNLLGNFPYPESERRRRDVLLYGLRRQSELLQECGFASDFTEEHEEKVRRVTEYINRIESSVPVHRYGALHAYLLTGGHDGSW